MNHPSTSLGTILRQARPTEVIRARLRNSPLTFKHQNFQHNYLSAPLGPTWNGYFYPPYQCIARYGAGSGLSFDRLRNHPSTSSGTTSPRVLLCATQELYYRNGYFYPWAASPTVTATSSSINLCLFSVADAVRFDSH